MAAGSLAYGLTIGLCALAGIVFLTMNLRRQDWESRTLSFAVVCLSGCAAGLTTIWLHTRPDIESYSRAVKWSFGFGALFQTGALLWLVAVWTGTGSRRTWIGFGIGAALLAVLQILTPNGLIVGEITSLRTVHLFGEQFVVHEGTSSPWRLVLDAYLIAITVFLVSALIRGWRRRRADTRVLVAALAVFVVLNGWDAMVDSGRFNTPYLLPFAFVFLTFAGAMHIARRAAETTVRLHDETVELRTLAADRSNALDAATGQLELSIEQRLDLDRQLASITSGFENVNSLSASVSDRAELHGPLVSLLGQVGELLSGDVVTLELDTDQVPQGMTAVTTWTRPGVGAGDAPAAPQQIHRETVNVGDRVLGDFVVSGGPQHRPESQRLSVVGLVVDQIAALVHRLQLSDVLTANAIDEERHRLARELHDSVTQRLYSAAFLAEALPRLTERDGGTAGETALRIRTMVLSSLAELRSLLFELRPLELDAAPIADLLRRLGENLRDTTSATIEVDTAEGSALPADIKIGLYRIAQEATANAARHANASVITIVLERAGAGARVEVRDDGRGFLVDDADVGHGLRTMKERAELIGAGLRVESSEADGSVISVVWPAVPLHDSTSSESSTSAEPAEVST